MLPLRRWKLRLAAGSQVIDSTRDFKFPAVEKKKCRNSTSKKSPYRPLGIYGSVARSPFSRVGARPC